MDFKRSVYGVDKMISCTGVDIKDYKDLYPLYVFDVSRQVETVGNSTTSNTTSIYFALNASIRPCNSWRDRQLLLAPTLIGLSNVIR